MNLHRVNTNTLPDGQVYIQTDIPDDGRPCDLPIDFAGHEPEANEGEDFPELEKLMSFVAFVAVVCAAMAVIVWGS